MQKPGENSFACSVIGLVGLLGKYPEEVQEQIRADAADPITGFVTVDSLQTAIAKYIAARGERPV
ncbi:MAG: hypothetical protein A3K06_01770 [Candidatus Doudnabacteria bacterium RIFCSPHIGHO2_01_52_17]|uniref:Uncharacterized protein n=1 Tax=Candidatus Doudnabacteria bacterium RIFCSPHIGHO2_01_52_17 TaxID=1817820 RepID=A0A1F5N932_9BACT|nr:MAG: hypothetical protein A3K06_01770 [Candidatus Doudnabacteria bacterium RIFCSPHIGHO2_01_52_17]